MRSRGSALLLTLLFLLMSFGLTSTASAHEGINHPWKELWPGRWYQTPDRQGGYGPYMTLTTHRHFQKESYANSWGPIMSRAINAWTNTDTTIWLKEDGTRYEWHDVHLAITDNDGFDHLGHHWETGEGTGGVAYWLNSNKEDCIIDCSPDNTYYSVVLVNDDWFFLNSDVFKEAVVSHELGHAIGLGHEPTLASGMDGDCGKRWPASIMDYDCSDQDPGKYHGPQRWDLCGVNHAYYDPRWGYAGCSGLR